MRSSHQKQYGSSLVVTLLCIAVLTIIVVAFLQSMTLEKKTAVSYSNLLKARMAAEAGIEDAAAKILRTLPKSASGLTNGTVVWTWSKSTNYSVAYTGILTNSIDVSGANMGVDRTVWLFSSTATANPDTISTNLEIQCNINIAGRVTGRSQILPVEWVDLTNSQLGQTIRSAWWVSDEAGRLPVASLGNTANTNYQTGSLSGLKVPGFSNVESSELENKRNVVSYLSGNSYLQVAPSSTNSPTSFATYVFPEASGLVGYGPFALQKRKNINEEFVNKTDSDFFVTNVSNYIEKALPAYAQRKNYLGGTVKRIVASLHDYIDSDDLPTFSSGYRSYFSNYASKTSDSGWPSYTDVNSFYGIEGVPRINEYLVYYGSASDTGLYGSANVAITRIMELWNMSQKPMTLSNVTVRVFRQQRAGAGFPPLDETLTGWTPATVTIQPNSFVALRLTRNYPGSYPSSFTDYRGSLSAPSNMGIILAASVNGSAVSVIDGFADMNLQANPADGKAGNSNGYSGSGDSGDNRTNLGRFLQRWASNTGQAHTPDAVNNSTYQSRRYQNVTTWFDMPVVGNPLGVSPSGPIAFIKNGPLEYLGELGDLWDPSNDLQEQSGRPRGGKTLVIGQFDPYFKSQGGVDNASYRSFQSYLRRADGALLDIFSVNDDPRVNINSPRPLVETNRPMAVLSGAFDGTNSFPQIPKPRFNATNLEAAVLDRLAKTNWRESRPFRNMNDLIGLGYSMTNAIFGSAGTNFWSSSTSKLWASPQPGTATLSALTGSQFATTLLVGNDRSREEAFRRISNWIDFSSLTFRVNASGQVCAKNGKQLARVNLEAVIGFIPEVVYNADGTTQSVNYRPQIQIIPDE